MARPEGVARRSIQLSGGARTTERKRFSLRCLQAFALQCQNFHCFGTGLLDAF
jgi:hypothetical protein